MPGVIRTDGLTKKRSARATRETECGRLLLRGAVNGVSGEAGAETANLIYRYGRISGCSGILFEKKI